MAAPANLNKGQKVPLLHLKSKTKKEKRFSLLIALHKFVNKISQSSMDQILKKLETKTNQFITKNRFRSIKVIISFYKKLKIFLTYLLLIAS